MSSAVECFHKIKFADPDRSARASCPSVCAVAASASVATVRGYLVVCASRAGERYDVRAMRESGATAERQSRTPRPIPRGCVRRMIRCGGPVPRPCVVWNRNNFLRPREHRHRSEPNRRADPPAIRAGQVGRGNRRGAPPGPRGRRGGRRGFLL